jgi:hypothetical protein
MLESYFRSVTNVPRPGKVWIRPTPVSERGRALFHDTGAAVKASEVPER